MWQVSAIGAETNSEYVYQVDAPDDAREMNVVRSAYRQHGELKLDNVVTEFLRPGGVARHIG